MKKPAPPAKSSRARETPPKGDPKRLAGYVLAEGPSPFRPRETPTQASREQVDAQVRTVIDLMTRGEWDDARGTALAQEWGISGIAMRDRTAQASRFVRVLSDPAEREQLRVRWLGMLDAIAMGAIEPRDRVAAIRVGVDLGALAAPSVAKVEVTQRGFTQMTEAEQLAQLRAAMPRMAERMSQLEAKERAGLLTEGKSDE